MRTLSALGRRIPLWALAAALLAPAGTAQARGDEAFGCGGEVESRTWKLWDDAGRALAVRNFLEDRLIAQGDSYGLYDFEGSTHNLVALAARCGRQDRLREFARIVTRAYDALEPLPAGGLGWVCRGGRVCSQGSTLRGTEVPLNSSQFLGLALRVASALAETGGGSEEGRDFVAASAMIAVDHLNRWSRDDKLLRLDERQRATPAQARDGQSKWFFTDVDLWILAIYGELAGIRQAVPALREPIDDALQPAARARLKGLLQLLRARLTLAPAESPRLPLAGRVLLADLDRGFWRHYRDNRYAGYEGQEPPVSCAAGKDRPRINVTPESVRPVDSGGWDFSHARRLVHVIDALDRQRAAMARSYKLASDAVPAQLAPAFAATLLVRVWNGDAQRPLFANYWDGSNGWYRAGHVSAGSCFEGYGPYGLSDAFALGGFALWSAHRPEIAPLARRIHALAASATDDDVAFIRRFYPGLGPGASSSVRTLAHLQFWPSLVEAAR